MNYIVFLNIILYICIMRRKMKNELFQDDLDILIEHSFRNIHIKLPRISVEKKENDSQ